MRHRLQRLLNDQHKAELDYVADTIVRRSEDEVSLQASHTSPPSRNGIYNNVFPGATGVLRNAADTAPMYMPNSDESSYAERDCSSDERSNSECESESESESESDSSNKSHSSMNSSGSGSRGSSGSNSNSNSVHNSNSSSVDSRQSDCSVTRNNTARNSGEQTEDTSTNTSNSDGLSDGSVGSSSSAAERSAAFLARLRSTGMDYITPRSSHYQVSLLFNDLLNPFYLKIILVHNTILGVSGGTGKSAAPTHCECSALV